VHDRFAARQLEFHGNADRLFTAGAEKSNVALFGQLFGHPLTLA
jgi:hypothetical protein